VHAGGSSPWKVQRVFEETGPTAPKVVGLKTRTWIFGMHGEGRSDRCRCQDYSHRAADATRNSRSAASSRCSARMLARFVGIVDVVLRHRSFGLAASGQGGARTRDSSPYSRCRTPIRRVALLSGGQRPPKRVAFRLVRRRKKAGGGCRREPAWRTPKQKGKRSPGIRNRAMSSDATRCHAAIWRAWFGRAGLSLASRAAGGSWAGRANGRPGTSHPAN